MSSVEHSLWIRTVRIITPHRRLFSIPGGRKSVKRHYLLQQYQGIHLLFPRRETYKDPNLLPYVLPYFPPTLILFTVPLLSTLAALHLTHYRLQTNRNVNSPFSSAVLIDLRCPSLSDNSGPVGSSSLSPPPDPTLSKNRSRRGNKGENIRSGLPPVPDRSGGAMWVGNVPSDATHEELWTFFSSRPFDEALDERGFPFLGPGLESLHLIARSNCAFVNYISKSHVEHAVMVSNGVSLRPLDRKTKPLVCRVRGVDEDAKAGVGGQRGEGVHRRYVKMLLDNTRLRKLGIHVGGTDALGDEQEEEKSWSDASSNSSLFEEFFPKRFFILKANNNEVLDDSVLSGVWRTQSHNEHTLNQAFRTAKEGVWIVFSANRSGEWYGYALMMGLIPSSDSLLASSSQIGFDPWSGVESEQVPGVEQLGKPFPIRWIEQTKVSFSKTRLLSNSFNMGREVKVSRDGTEIEPETGALLLKKFASVGTPLLTTTRSSSMSKTPVIDPTRVPKQQVLSE